MPITAKATERRSGGVRSAMRACAVERLPAVAPSIARETYTSQSVSARAMSKKPSIVPS